jgi:hypothetical protein
MPLHHFDNALSHQAFDSVPNLAPRFLSRKHRFDGLVIGERYAGLRPSIA